MSFAKQKNDLKADIIQWAEGNGWCGKKEMTIILNAVKNHYGFGGGDASLFSEKHQPKFMEFADRYIEISMAEGEAMLAAKAEKKEREWQLKRYSPEEVG